MPGPPCINSGIDLKRACTGALRDPGGIVDLGVVVGAVELDRFTTTGPIQQRPVATVAAGVIPGGSTAAPGTRIASVKVEQHARGCGCSPLGCRNRGHRCIHKGRCRTVGIDGSGQFGGHIGPCGVLVAADIARYHGVGHRRAVDGSGNAVARLIHTAQGEGTGL